MTSVVIVGAGIAGLTLASALTRFAPDVRVHVVERDHDVLSRAQGYSVALRNAEGMAVLRELEVAGSIEAVSRPVPGLRLLSTSGRPLFRFAVASGDARALTAAPRARLREVLLGTLPADIVTWNARAVGFHADGDLPEIRLDDDSVHAGDLVVACDGARSVARQDLLGQPLRWVGLTRIGGMADPVVHPLLEAGPSMTLGRGCSFFVHPLAHERLMWSFALRTADESQLMQCPAGELLQRVAAATRKWHEPIPTLVAETHEADVDVRPLFDVPPPTQARVARVCFAGDASHAMTPYRGRGANMAMMDALELATRLAEPNVSVDSALEAYELAMLPRNRRALALSHAASQTLHPTSRAGAFLRNVRLRAGRLRTH